MNLRTGPSCIITVFLLLLALCHGAATEKQSNVKGRRRAQGAPGPGDKGALSTDSKDKRKGKTVTLKGLKSILLTETNEEFSASSNSTVNQDMFQAAGDNQLELALLAENRTIDYMKATGKTVPLPTYPFIICHEAQNISGYQRMADISILGASHAEALLNADQHSCWFVQSVASNASALVAENANLSIAAVGPYCKLRQGIIDAIENEGATEFLVQLCPGALKPEPGAPPGRPGPNGDSLDMVWQDILSSLQTFVDTNMTADTSNNTGARKLQNQRSLVTENFFWTHLLERTSHFQNSGGRKLISEHPRAAMWARALQEGIDSSHHCSDMFRELHMSPLEDGNSFRLQIGGSFDLGSGSNRRLESFTQPSTHCVLSLIAGVSQNPAVCSVVNAPAVSLHNHQAAWIVQSGQPDYRSWFEAGIRGKNQVVAIADTGVDSNHCYFTDGEPFDKSGIVDFSRRKVIHYKGVDNMDSIGGHGTHAAGTIAGALSSGYGMSEGIARDAKLSVFDISDDSNMTDPVCCKLPKDWTRILNISYTNATARVQSFSWGARYNQYHTYDQWMDTFVYNNPDMVIVVAAGNTGASYAVGSPAVAKNVIAVGSTFSAGSDIKSGGSDQHYLSTFSSRGPTADGRIKPDVVAPGQSILSARARPDLSSTCDPASAPELGKSSGGLMYRMGTSMSTPVVSGTVALIRQYFQEGWFVSGSKNEAVGFNPSAALVKAILINGAQSLLGIGTTSGNITDIDYNQGFGRINLHNVVPFGNNSISLIAGKDKVITNGEIHSLSIQIQLTSMCSLSEVTVSLVWTDPPAATGMFSIDVSLFLLRKLNQIF